MTEQTNTPELRFPEFKGEWEEKKLGDTGVFRKSYSFSRAKEGEGIYRHIHYGDIHSKLPEIVYDNNLLPQIKENKDFVKVQKGDLIFADASEDYDDLGKAITLDFNPQNIIAGLHTHLFTLEKNYDNKFLVNYTKTNKYRTFIRKVGTGISVLGISKKSLSNFNILTPFIDEQEKIGDFFSKLDRQIELEEEKLELLEQQKRGYMQKVFSQELRFKDEKDDYYSDWENYQLKDLTYYKNGKGYEKVATTNGKYNIINLNSVGVKGQLKDSGKYTDFEDDTLLKNDLIMILSDVAKGNLIGMTAIIDENNKYLLNQRIALLRIENPLITNAYFLYLYINFNRKYFINMSTGMSQLNINKKTVEDFPVNLPNIEEQNKIAILFKNYEDNIKKQASKVKLLKQRKKGLLQKMFV